MRIVAAEFAVLSAALAAAGCAKQRELPTAEAAAPVRLAIAVRQTIRRVITADATLYPVEQADVMPKISAPVARFYVNRGDHVRAGQPLARMENRDLLAAARAAHAQTAQAQSNLRNTAGATVPEAETKARADLAAARQAADSARRLLDNRRWLYEQGALARKLVDEAQTQNAQAAAEWKTAEEHLRALEAVAGREQIAAAEAQVRQAREQAESAEAQAGYAIVRSPIGGVVASRPLYQGDMASTGQPVATIMNIASVVARANVPQTEVSRIRVGNAATIRGPAGDVEAPGRVTVVSPAANPGTTTVEVWVQAVNPREELKPGETVRVSIVTATVPNAIVVPESALVATPEGQTVVWTVSRGRAHANAVAVGARQGGAVQILAGIAAGARVIAEGALGLEEGARVRVEHAAPALTRAAPGAGRP